MSTTLILADEGRPSTSAALPRPWLLTLGVGAGTLIAALIVSTLLGSTLVSPGAWAESGSSAHAVLEARWERSLVALAVGAALGVAGALMQGLTRNPLADPGILGVNAGASLAMVLAIAAGVSSLEGYLWWGLAGAGCAIAVVHAIASLGRDGATPVKLTITGAALTAAATSWTTAILVGDQSAIESHRRWSVGTVGGRDLDVLGVGLPFLVVGLLLALASAKLLDAQAMGDDVARSLGRRVIRDRLVVGLAIVLLAGTATALAGPISFVGLLVPHAVRLLVGPDHARLLPLSALAGAVLVLLADTAGRIVLPPSEVQVGIMTALLGAPLFLGLVRRGRWVAQ